MLSSLQRNRYVLPVSLPIIIWFFFIHSHSNHYTTFIPVGFPFTNKINTPSLTDFEKVPKTDFRSHINTVSHDFWWKIKPNYRCSTPVEHIGRYGEGQKYMCGLGNLGKDDIHSQNAPCLVYSYGVNNESSFEAEVLLRTYCKVFAYDPTVDSIGYPLKTSNRRVTFEKLGIGGVDKGDKRTLATFMKNNGGHTWIDILKVDVELWEYPAMQNIFEDFKGILPFGQLLIEFHVGNWTKTQTKELVEMLEEIENRGMRLYHTEPRSYCTEFTFMNLFSEHIFQ